MPPGNISRAAKNKWQSVGSLVDEIHDAHIWDAGVVLKAYLAGATVAVAYRDVVGLNFLAQVTQRIAVHLGMDEATVACETTTAHTLGHDNLVGAQPRQSYKVVHKVHLTH